MTREEALQWLNDRKAKYSELIRRYPCSSQLRLTIQVIDMAIEALSANCTTEKPNDEVEQGNDVVVEPTDLISRADAIEAVEDGMCTFYDCDVLDRINAVPSAKAVKVAYIYDGRKCDVDCSDCFRTLDIEHAKDFKLIGGVYYQEESADRPSGEWVRSGNTLICPICGAKGEDIKDDYCFNYCPNCGAYMRNQNNEQR